MDTPLTYEYMCDTCGNITAEYNATDKYHMVCEFCSNAYKRTLLTNRQLGALTRNKIDPLHDITLCETLLGHPVNEKLFNERMRQYDEKLKQPYVSKYTPPEPPAKPVPKCPTCGSTKVKNISGTKRWLTVGLFGLVSSNLGKQCQCGDCGYKW